MKKVEVFFLTPFKCISDVILMQFRCQSLDGVKVGDKAESEKGSLLFQGWVVGSKFRRIENKTISAFN